MATTISLNKNQPGSPLIGSPITYDVTASAVTGTVSFHNVILQIKAGLEGSDYVTYESRSPVESGETVSFDISSALRAAAESYEYTAIPPSHYPYVKFSLKAYDEYMQNGELHEKVGEVSNDGGCALLGSYSDLDRFLASGSKTATIFTRKPTSMPEIVCDGETFVRPVTLSTPVTIGNILDSNGNVSNIPSSTVYNVTIDSTHPAGLRSLGGVQVYVAPKMSDRYLFRFINGLGVMESIGVNTLREASVGITKNDYTLTTQEKFSEFSRYLVTKRNNAETWKMSSGPVDMLWQQWFLHEFLMTEHCWILIEGNWIPCIIVPEETVTSVNRHDHSKLQVEFSVKLDINGSPYLAV